ncbi:MAG: ABC transporter permease [Cyclobacteriaceae bacterium]|nr:ABC transporter permease [Cyclobacteriaceae bacterium]MDH4296083.1 ABC transporter permease [Cyclobacteriaceae bacterium]MDH5249764.1 ABC transporter permease [Cyclobacteriaceae bacterium]
MYSSYFKIGWRSLWKNKGHFAINTAGLALGIATCLIISMFIADELSYDRYNEKADNIVRVVLKGSVNGETIKEAVTPAPVGPTLKEEFPEVLEATRLRRFGSPKIVYENNTYRNSRLAFVDPNFFEVFTLPLLMGDPKTALKNPNSIVITKEEALKFFGDEDPIDKVLEFRDRGEQYTVKGVIQNVPANSHFHFDLFASMEGVVDAKVDNWMSSNYFNYLVLSKGTNVEAFESKLPAIIAKYMGPQVAQIGMSFEKFVANGNEIGLYVQPLTAIHLFSDFSGQTELEPGGDIKLVYIFGAIALFMLLIACINFINLSTAAATRRSKEVGVKKILGSQKRQLIYQFLTESLIATGLAMVLAILLVGVVLPVFNQLSGKMLEVSSLLNPVVWVILVVLGIVITFLAGSYPAFFLSSFRPIDTLKSKVSYGGGSKGVRSVLVVFQFVISVGLIMAIIIVTQQMSYIQSKKIGYDRDQILVLRESYLLGNNESVFRDQLLNEPSVERVTMSGFVPAGPTDNNMMGVYPGTQKEAVRRTLVYNIDEQYIPTMGMELIAGRNFSSADSDSSNVIINETAAKIFELGDNPLGMTLTANSGKRSLIVIGIVKDFHFKSLHETIAPLVMLNNPYGGLIIRTNSKDIAGLLTRVMEMWNAFHAEEPFSYALLDELYNETYLTEQKMGDILKIFGFLTILVACLGLFGLITFTAEQRIKEIGIRKVLGASVSQIVSLLSRDLILLVAISFIIAFPMGFYLMNKWLQDFAYRIDIQWWVFALSGLITIIIAFVTMSFKTIQSALANPVDSLRSD